ncbi:6864_t:CDS:2 [Dentiscutata heterogama]|uniref:6864_t:CDS:1 n=1 Tax=Dentiscutata heterogama TaxID=1316150 RepID=A0ACA9LET9_9GLOM|nr:6864_t:CDS:2 [Dentiscutata heterogama]
MGFVLVNEEQLHLRFHEDLDKKNGSRKYSKSGSKISVVEFYARFLDIWPLCEPDVLYISPTIKIGSKSPIIFQCYSYMQHLVRRCPSTGETLPLSSSSNINSDASGSNYKETLKAPKQENFVIIFTFSVF